MKYEISVEIWKRGSWYIAKAPELNFVSQGTTSEEARQNLFELIKIQIEEMKELGTLDTYLAECGFTLEGDALVPDSEMIGFERMVLVSI